MNRRRIALAAALLLALAAGGLHGPLRRWLHGDAAPAEAVPRASASSVPVAPTPPRAAPVAAADAASASPLQPTIAAAPASAPWEGLSHAPHCGADEGPQHDPHRALKGKTVISIPASDRYAAATARLDEALRTNADPYLRGIGWMLQLQPELKATAPAPAPAEALASLALASDDPRLYALAYGTCRSLYRAPPACGRLGARRWVQIDAGNAVPWLAVMDEAARVGDVQAQREALREASSASRFDRRLFAPAAAIAALFPEDDDMLAVAEQTALSLYGRSAMAQLAYKGVADLCRDRAGGDALRAGQCVQLAALMRRHADDLSGFVMGGAVDFLATGDPTEREHVAAARAEVSAIAASAQPGLPRGPGCETVRTALQYHRRAAEIGEMAAIRELAASEAGP